MSERLHSGACVGCLARLALVAILTLASIGLHGLGNPEPADEGIRFLRIKAGGGGFNLVSASLRPGRLKQPRDGSSRGDVACELVDADGRVLWRGRIEDPLRTRVEVAEPGEQGRFHVRELVLAESEFTLRVPHVASATELRLRREPEGSEAVDGAAAKAAWSRLVLPKLPTQTNPNPVKPGP